MAGLVHDHNGEKRMEKQIGCMSGFLQIFDRQQILAGKRIHSTKRLPPSTGVGASSEAVSSVESQEFSKELERPEPEKHVVVVPTKTDSGHSSPTGNANGSPIATQSKSPLLVPMFEPKGETQKREWKFCKKTARLSLDSMATVDSKETIRPRDVRTSNSALSTNCSDSNTSITDGDFKQRRSPSVIARLMGLESLSSSDHKSQPAEEPALRRSASDSRVSRDLCRSKYIDGNNFQVKQPNQTQKQTVGNIVKDERSLSSNRGSVNGGAMKSMALGNLKSESPRTSPWRLPQQRRGYDASDIYPEPNQTTVSMDGDFEKKLKMRGMDEQSNDLGTLKQILEVLQLKGLLHSRGSPNRNNRRNLVYDRNLPSDESSIIVMKPWRSPTSKVDNQTSTYDSRGARRYASESSLSISPKREGATPLVSGRSPMRARNSSPTRIESNLKMCNAIVKKKPLSIEAQRRANESSDSPRISPTNSPKFASKKHGSANHSPTNRSRRNEKPTGSSYINPPKQKSINNIVTDDESSSISESTVSTHSTTDTERSKCEGCREGRSLLHRCDKLLHNTTKMSSATESPPSSTMVLPSPVSVLDSGFDKDESSSPSHSIDFKATTAVDLEEEVLSHSIIPTKSTEREEFISDDSDFIYISEVLGASQSLQLQQYSDVFLSIEKQLYCRNDTSDVSKNRRKLVFDVVVEILDKIRKLPPWKAASLASSATSLKQIWFEFQKIRETNNNSDGVLGLIGGVLKKDVDKSNNGWGDHPIETSEAILDIERLIFKDLVGEAIREFSGDCMFSRRPQRKLVFYKVH